MGHGFESRLRLQESVSIPLTRSLCLSLTGLSRRDLSRVAPSGRVYGCESRLRFQESVSIPLTRSLRFSLTRFSHRDLSRVVPFGHVLRKAPFRSRLWMQVPSSALTIKEYPSWTLLSFSPINTIKHRPIERAEGATQSAQGNILRLTTNGRAQEGHYRTY